MSDISPQRRRCTVKTWLNGIRVGYLWHPDDSGIEVYVNYADVPLRPEKGIARLFHGEVVECEISAGAHGYVAKKISFPSPK
jgi:cold shock CspA family protein